VAKLRFLGDGKIASSRKACNLPNVRIQRRTQTVLVEDWVERCHKIGFQLEEQNKRTSTLEGRAKALSERQELINNVKVMDRALEGWKATSRGPRKKRNLSERQCNWL
jgi:hypothetical protein